MSEGEIQLSEGWVFCFCELTAALMKELAQWQFRVARLVRAVAQRCTSQPCTPAHRCLLPLCLRSTYKAAGIKPDFGSQRTAAGRQNKKQKRGRATRTPHQALKYNNSLLRLTSGLLSGETERWGCA